MCTHSLYQAYCEIKKTKKVAISFYGHMEENGKANHLSNVARQQFIPYFTSNNQDS